MKDHPKSASLHEFEKIYRFETINPASVRKITPQKTISETTQEVVRTEPVLDLFPTASRLLLEREPIESLQLSPFAMRALKSISVTTVGQLRHILTSQKEQLRSIGQGHLDELEHKISASFLRLQSLNAPQADLSSFLRFILSPLPPKERARVALLYNLKPFCLIPLGDEKEAESSIRHLTENTKNELLSKLISQLHDTVQEAGSILFSSYIQNKLNSLGGIASIETMSLLLFSDSGLDSYTQFQNIDTFLKKLSPRKTIWFAPNAVHINEQFIAASLQIAKYGEQVLLEADIIRSFSKTAPTLEEMKRLLWKKQALSWQELDERAINEVLFWHSFS